MQHAVLPGPSAQVRGVRESDIHNHAKENKLNSSSKSDGKSAPGVDRACRA